MTWRKIMGESGLVVAMHAVSLIGIGWCAWEWAGFIRDEFRNLLSNAMGLLVLALASTYSLLAFGAVYYSIARIEKYIDPPQHTGEDLDLWHDEFAIFLAAIRILVLWSCLLTLAARWRVHGMSCEDVRARSITVVVGGTILYAAIAALLW